MIPGEKKLQNHQLETFWAEPARQDFETSNFIFCDLTE
jgi:hypothetical protein